MRRMLVRDAMTHLAVTLRRQDPLHVAAERLAANGISGAPVVEAGKVVGVLSESDIIRMTVGPAPIERAMSPVGVAIAARPMRERLTVEDAMTPTVVTASPDMNLWTAAAIMERRGIKRLPVVDPNGFLIGIISRADLVRVMARSDEEIRSDVLDAIIVLGEDTLGDLKVEVEDGVVTLKGTVDRRSTARIAVELASHIVGVVEVQDMLRFEFDDARVPAVAKVPGRLTSLQDHWENRDWVART